MYGYSPYCLQKGNNFRGFLFTSLGDVVLPKLGLLLKGKCLEMCKLFPFRSDSLRREGRKMKMIVLLFLKVYTSTLKKNNFVNAVIVDQR